MLILRTPENAKTLELANSIIWFEDGILFSRPKPGAYINLTRKEMIDDVLRMKDFIGHKKVCMIAESHPEAESPRKEDNNYISQQLSETIKALAIITPNAVSRLVANMFFLIKPAQFPTKMFVSDSDAKKWLENCFKKGQYNKVL